MIDEIVKYIRYNAPKSYGGTDAELARDLKWYWDNDRIVVLRDDIGAMAGVITFNPVSSLDFLATHEFPKDDPFGEILWIVLAIVNEEYRVRDLWRGLTFKVISAFPRIKHIVFEHGIRDERLEYIPLERILSVTGGF